MKNKRFFHVTTGFHTYHRYRFLSEQKSFKKKFVGVTRVQCFAPKCFTPKRLRKMYPSRPCGSVHEHPELPFVPLHMGKVYTQKACGPCASANVWSSLIWSCTQTGTKCMQRASRPCASAYGHASVTSLPLHMGRVHKQKVSRPYGSAHGHPSAISVPLQMGTVHKQKASRLRCSEIRFVTRRLVETFCGMGGVQGSHSKIQYIKITP